ncbi:MAG: hypothetical protein C4342_01515, partial [Armatimonadota bacterium]
MLLYVLEENCGLHINGTTVLGECASEDETGRWRVNPECVFTNIERAAKAVPDFEVKRRVILANFQFAKMAMVEDLKRNGDTIASSAIVAAV